MTAEMKTGLLEIILNGKTKYLKAKKKEDYWQYQSGNKTKNIQLDPTRLREMLIKYYEEEKIDVDINIYNTTVSYSI